MAISVTAQDLEAHNRRCVELWGRVADARAELGAKTGLYREALDAREAAERACALERGGQRTAVARLVVAGSVARAERLWELGRRDAGVADAAGALCGARRREREAHTAMCEARGRLEDLDSEYQVLNGELAYMARGGPA